MRYVYHIFNPSLYASIFIRIVCAYPTAPFFFPGLFFYVYIESPNSKNPEGPTPQAPNPINWKHQPQKPNIRLQPQNPKPQTTINEPK